MLTQLQQLMMLLPMPQIKAVNTTCHTLHTALLPPHATHHPTPATCRPPPAACHPPPAARHLLPTARHTLHTAHYTITNHYQQTSNPQPSTPKCCMILSSPSQRQQVVFTTIHRLITSIVQHSFPYQHPPLFVLLAACTRQEQQTALPTYTNSIFHTTSISFPTLHGTPLICASILYYILLHSCACYPLLPHNSASLLYAATGCSPCTPLITLRMASPK